MIGDGMGTGQTRAASEFRWGAPDGLFMETLPVQGEVVTGSPSGITDSAASGTALAAGALTYNGRVATDRDGVSTETLTELAHTRGMGAGIVSTALLPHATNACFSAHVPSRSQLFEIAAQQVRTVTPEVMLGGGSRYFESDGAADSPTPDLRIDLAAAGYQVVASRDELIAAASATRLFGTFGAEHMPYVRSRDDTIPNLSEMAMTAIEVLDRNDQGFFLMIEGGRIDHAGHANDLDNVIAETLEFDDAVRAVSQWADGAGYDVTLLVTADHETGGLTVVEPRGIGENPEVTWRWGAHTNARVRLSGSGPGAQRADRRVVDQRFVHAICAAAVAGREFSPPQRQLVPDGRLTDLRHVAATQTVSSDFGPGFSRLDELRIDADERGLAIGVRGLFRWGQDATVLLIDIDPEANTGPIPIVGPAPVDGIVTSLVTDQPMSAGFAPELAIVTIGGTALGREQSIEDAGLRYLSGEMPARQVAINFGDLVRTGALPTPVVPEHDGLETFIPWDLMFPGLSGAVFPGATIGIVVLQTSSDGAVVSNQRLPAGAGVVRFIVDLDGDGIADGSAPPVVVAN